MVDIGFIRVVETPEEEDRQRKIQESAVMTTAQYAPPIDECDDFCGNEGGQLEGRGAIGGSVDLETLEQIPSIWQAIKLWWSKR